LSTSKPFRLDARWSYARRAAVTTRGGCGYWLQIALALLEGQRRRLFRSEVLFGNHAAASGPFPIGDKGYRCIVVDSFSHAHAGEGGLLDWQEEILSERVERAMARDGERRKEYELRDAYQEGQAHNLTPPGAGGMTNALERGLPW